MVKVTESLRLEFALSEGLPEEDRADLERQISMRLGLVCCVRHPPAIDSVVVESAGVATRVVVSACCALTARRAKILMGELLQGHQR